MSVGTDRDRRKSPWGRTPVFAPRESQSTAAFPARRMRALERKGRLEVCPNEFAVVFDDQLSLPRFLADIASIFASMRASVSSIVVRRAFVASSAPF